MELIEKGEITMLIKKAVTIFLLMYVSFTPYVNAEPSCEGVLDPIIVQPIGSEQDDTGNVQTAINTAILCGISTVELKQYGTYYLKSDNSLNTLQIWGSVILKGNNATLIDQKTKEGEYGGTIAIFGKINGRKYPVDAPYFDNNIYVGTDEIARDVTISNLTIKHEHPVPNLRQNSLGIVFADNINILGVVSIDSPQTAFAIISTSLEWPASNILLDNTHSYGSLKESYRISLQETGDNLTVTMRNCGASNVAGEISGQPSGEHINGKRVALWYRAGKESDNLSLDVINCNFDETGEVFVSNGARNLTIRDSIISGGMSLYSSWINDNILIENNVFELSKVDSPVYLTWNVKGFIINNTIVGEKFNWIDVQSDNGLRMIRYGNHSPDGATK